MDDANVTSEIYIRTEHIYISIKEKEKYTNKERTTTRHQIKIQVKKGTTLGLVSFNTKLPSLGNIYILLLETTKGLVLVIV